VRSSWKRLDIWLTTHAPATAASLQAGATETQLVDVEKALGRKLPADFRECFLIHNGQDIANLGKSEDTLFPDGVLFLSLEECEHHRDGGNVASLAAGLIEEDDNGNTIPKAPETVKTGGRGKGGKGLGRPDACPFSAFLSFASSEGLGREESSTGFLLGFVKGSPARVVTPWSLQDNLSVPSAPLDFATWFCRFVNKTIESKSTDTSSKLASINCIITGIFSVEHELLTALIERHGGTVSQRVTGLTTHMLLGETGNVGMYNTLTGKGSKKYREAKKCRRIKIWNEEELRAVISGTAS